jgi:hypothetical protein
MNMKMLIIILLACIALSSCMPYHYTVVPHTYGKVVDKASGEPVAGARVLFKEHPSEAVLTKPDGTFDIPQRQEWIAVPFGPFDAMPPRLNLLIEAEGYQTTEIGNLRSWEISRDKIEIIRK